MPAGKAAGRARDYQVQCRDLLIRRIGEFGPLEPLEGDGIDIPLRLGAPTVTFDVALCAEGGRLVVAECKRWRPKDLIKQADVCAFAYSVELLRRHTGKEVAAFFFTTSDYQVGALKTAIEPGVWVAICDSGADPLEVPFAFLGYDPEREQRLRNWQVIDSAALAESAAVTVVDEPTRPD